MKRLTVAVAALLLGTVACSAYPYIGQVTTGGSSGAAASGGGGTDVTSTGTNGGSASGGVASGSTTTGGTTAIGDPEFAATDTAREPNPCEVDFDFGNVGIGLVSSETFTVSNVGNGVLDLLASDSTLDPAFVLIGEAPSPIQPGGQLQFSVSFTPTELGWVMSTLTVPTDGEDTRCPGTAGVSTSSLTLQLTGTGITSCLQVQSDILDFGNTEINTANEQSVTLRNTCTAPETNIVATVAGVDSNLFVVNNAPTTLQAGAQATVDITYSPLALETRSIANVTFSDTDSEPATVNLFGEPVAVALTVAPNPCAFGQIPFKDEGYCCTTITDQANVTVTITDVVNVNGMSELNGNMFDDAGFIWDGWQQIGDPGHLESAPIVLDPGGGVVACFAFFPFSTQAVTEQATLETNDPSGNNPVIWLTAEGVDAGLD